MVNKWIKEHKNYENEPENIEGENEEIIEDKKIEPTDEEVKAVDSDEIENTETEILLKKRKGSRSSKSTRKTRKLRDIEGRVDHKIVLSEKIDHQSIESRKGT